MYFEVCTKWLLPTSALEQFLSELRNQQQEPMSAILIRGGRVIDPANGLDAIADVLVAEGKIKVVGEVRDSDLKPFKSIAAGLEDIQCQGALGDSRGWLTFVRTLG